MTRFPRKNSKLAFHFSFFFYFFFLSFFNVLNKIITTLINNIFVMNELTINNENEYFRKLKFGLIISRVHDIIQYKI